MPSAREIHLVSYPQGLPQPSDFALKQVELPEPGPGQMLIRTVWMSVDPYMRGRMRPEVKSYIPPFQLDQPLDGGMVGQVVASRHDQYQPGDYVTGFSGGWRDHHLSDGRMLQKISPDIAPLSAFLGVLGLPGMTAWIGIKTVLELEAGQTLFVSAAAGAVGSLACQLGKRLGARVIGSAGSADKIAWLIDGLGGDAAINYKDHADARSLTKALAAAAPDGVDRYFENVGGQHLEAALNCLNDFGRIAVCGMISQYNATAPEPGPSNLTVLIARRARMQGFLLSDHLDQTMAFFHEVGGWLREGKIHYRETVYDGLDKAPEAFIGLFTGDNVGKAVVRVGSERCED